MFGRTVNHSHNRPRYRHALASKPWTLLCQGAGRPRVASCGALMLKELGMFNTPTFGNQSLTHHLNWPFFQGYFEPGQSQNNTFGCV